MAIRSALAVLLFLLNVSLLQSQNIVWQQTDGPYAPRIVRKLLNHPSGDIYCFARGLYSDNYLLRSSDHGETWSEVNRRYVIPNTSTTAPLLIDYLTVHNDGSLYASASVQGVYRSTNKGATWEKVFDRLGSISSFTLLGINSSGHMFALPFMSSNGYVYCSTNNGVSWERRENGLDTRFPTNVNFFIDEFDILYLRDFNGKSYCSTDNGLQWSLLSTGAVDFMTVHSKGVLFLGASNSTNYTAKLLRSTDQGKSWTEIFPDIYSKKLRVMNMLPGASGQLFLFTKDSLLVSSDLGDTWRSTNPPLSGEAITEVSTSADGKILVGTDMGRFYRSANSGTSWTKSGTQLRRCVSASCFTATSKNVIFAGSYSDGLFSTTNNGLSWNPSSVSIGGSSVMSLAVNERDQLFLGTSSGGLFTSTDNGVTWPKINTALPTKAILWIGSNSKGHLFVQAQQDLYRSTDEGVTWVMKATSSSVYNMCVMINANDDIWASLSSDLCVSTDNGETWSKRNAGLPASPVVTALTSNELGTLYLGTQTGALYASTDQGNTWISKPTGLRGPSNKIKNIICLQNNQLMINVDAASGYVGIDFEDYGIFHSTNNGSTWQFVNTTSSQSSRETAVALYKTKDNKMLAGVSHGVMIGTPAATSVHPPERQLAGQFTLEQNYPNPFNPSTVIQYGMPNPGYVSLRILNALGQEVGSLVNERKEAGSHQAIWIANVPSGVYFYRLVAGTFMDTKKMILLR